jgi:pyridoxamine 5'-phosphate oxidase
MNTLPKPAPADPLPLAERWLADAAANVPKNPWAMALATVSASGRPSVRYVLLKALLQTDACIVFYTNYDSRKAGELETATTAAGVLYWPGAGRQLRIEGRVERSPASESDAYFASRPRLSQLNAWASEQSRSIAAPELMADRLARREAEFADMTAIPRPDGWGGYRLFIEAIEFWIEGAGRFHERLRYERVPADEWSVAWLQP